MADVASPAHKPKRQRCGKGHDDPQQIQQLSGVPELLSLTTEAPYERRELESQRDWSFMSPWCEHLRGRLEMDTGGGSAAGGLWITVEPSDLRLQESEALGTRMEQEYEQLQCTREALKLLALVAHVDNAAWYRLVTDECELLVGDLNGDSGVGPLEPAADQDAVLKPRFLVVVDTSSDYLQAGHVPSPAQQYHALFLRRQLPTIAFLHAKERILALQPSSNRLWCPVAVPVALQVTLCSLSPPQIHTYLEQLLEVIQAMRAADRTPMDDEHACVFRFAFLQLYVNGSKLTQPLAAQLLALLDAGVPVSELSLSLNWGLSSRSDKRTARATLGHLLATMLCSSDGAAEAMEGEAQELDHQQDAGQTCRRGGVASLVVECDYAHTWRFAALGSALAMGGLESLRKLRLENICRTHTTAARRLNWRWLALGLFAARPVDLPVSQSFGCRHAALACRRRKRVTEESQHAVELTGVRLSLEDLREIHNVLMQQAEQTEREGRQTAEDTAAETVPRSWRLPRGTWLRLRYGVDEEDYEAVSGPVQLPRGASVVDVKQPQTMERATATVAANAMEEGDLEEQGRAAESDWVDVLVPGYGQCSVARSCMKASALPLSLAWQSRGPSTATVLTSLNLSFSARTQQESAGLPGLLRFVGRSLRSLSLQLNGLGVLDALVPTLLSYCPRLQDLRLDGDNLNLDAFAAEYERLSSAYEVGGAGETSEDGEDSGASYPPPRLESLAFVNFRSRDRGTVVNASRFAWLLANPESALARSTKELSVFPLQDASPLDNDTLFALVAALDTNHRLERLNLLVLPAYYETWVGTFERHNYELLPVRKGPLPLRCKLAFLSLARRAQGRMDDGERTGVTDALAGIGRLDRQALTLVFELAASSAMRLITFQSDSMG